MSLSRAAALIRVIHCFRKSPLRALRSRLYRKAKEQILHSATYSYRDRKARKGDFRKLWITRINAAARLNDMTYNRFMQGLKLAASRVVRRFFWALTARFTRAT